MNIGILLWNTCDASCAHCAVSSSPTEARVMSNSDIKKIIDGAFLDGKKPSIGLSGGEAFLYLADLLEIVAHAVQKGGRVSVNTNCHWAQDMAEARRIVRLVKKAGVHKLVASTDTFHKKYIDDQCVIHAVNACIEAHLEIEIQYVATRKTERMFEFIEKHADDLVNITCREIPCHPVGRAEKMKRSALILRSKLPKGTCPNAVLSVSADGRYIPCCNTAGHLKALQMGTIAEDQQVVARRYAHSPVMRKLWEKGPISFVASAQAAGFVPQPLGYVDQCHLCHDLFKDTEISAQLKKLTDQEAFNELYGSYQAYFQV